MHQSISEWPSAQFYSSNLLSHSSASSRVLTDLPSVAPTNVTSAVVAVLAVEPTSSQGFYPTTSGGYEMRGAGGAIVNRAEARAVAAHVNALLASGVPASAIAVISPYSAQVALLQRLLAGEAGGEGGEAPESAAVEVSTIDAFQGREAEAVVLSLVRSNRRKSIGFLADRRRLNVAVTRARRHLAIVCDPSTVRADPLLASLLAHAERVGMRASGDSAGREIV